jgi:Flp pilus assembly protein TadD
MAAQEGRLPEAIARWRKAVELNPNDYQTLFNLATTLEKQGDLGGARANLEAYVRVAPPALEGKDIVWARAWLARQSGR